MPGKYSHKVSLLFDLDGTLVDSSPAHAHAFVAALQPAHPGLAGTFSYPPHQGRPTAEVMRALGLADEAELGALTRRKQQLYLEAVAAGRVLVFPGVPDLLRRLSAAGRRLFIVTGASRNSAERVLAGTQLTRFFTGLVTADDASPGKPAPQPYRHVLQRHQLVAADCLAVEDAENGVRSARAAGLEVVLVNTDLQLPGVLNAGPVAALAGLLLP